MDLNQVLDPDEPESDDEELNEDGSPPINLIDLADGNIVDAQALAEMLRNQWDLDPKGGMNKCIVIFFNILSERSGPQ